MLDETEKVDSGKRNIFGALFWKLLERFGVLGIQFFLQIILARILAPEHYGVLSLLVVFTALGNVFIQNGFNTSLIQNKDVTEEDYSSVFWISIIIAGVLYGLIFVFSPVVAAFYSMPEIEEPLRVIALVLFPGALNSIQIAKVRRELNFKKIFYSNIGAVVLSGILGILIAYFGGGIWALVIQYVSNVLLATIIMGFTIKLKIRWVCNIKRVKIMFSFGWKLLVSSLLETLYQDLQSLVVGKKYDSGVLGYYNRGKQFPQFIINAINGTVQAVMLPVMSAEQDDCEKVKNMTRNSIMISSYIIFPIMVGLAAVATPLITVILTEKWLPCVPYMQIYCFTLAIYPIHSCNLQAINAMGRSDIFLKLEVAKKIVGVIALITGIVAFDSPIAIAMTGMFSSIISSFINAYPNKRLIGYSYGEQIQDVLPSLTVSLFMGVAVWLISSLKVEPIIMLLVQISIGIVIYVLISKIFKLKPYEIVSVLLMKKIRRN